MRYGSVCSGIEAASVAWELLGWEPAFFSEIDGHCNAVLNHHWPDVPNLGSLVGLSERLTENERAIDVLVGGTPCQSFSIAGLRGGLDDSRGNLAFEYCRVLEAARPRWFVWENVPGVTSSLSHASPDQCPPDIDLDGEDGPENGAEVVVVDEYDADEEHAFACILAAFSELGYGWMWRTLDAEYVRVESHPFAVPQRRKRVFVVGYLGDWRPPVAVLLERESLRGDSPPRRTSGQDVAGTLGSRSTAGGGLGTDFECDGGVVVGTVTAQLGTDGPGDPNSAEFLVADVAPTLTENHYRDQKGMEDGLVVGKITAYGGGNTRGPIDVATCQTAHSVRMSFDSETLVAHTLTGEGFDASEDGTGRGPPLVNFPAKDSRGDHASRKGLRVADVAPTLNAAFAEKQGLEDQHINQDAPLFVPFDLTNITSKTNRSNPKSGDPMHTLHSDARNSVVAFSCNDYGQDVGDVSPTLRAMPHDKSHPNGGHQVAIAIQERAVSENPENGPDGKGWRDDGSSYALEARHHPQSVAVTAIDARQDPCVYENHTGAHGAKFPPHAVAISLRGRDGGGTAEISGDAATALRASQGGGDKQHVMVTSDDPLESGDLVRRITPLESERLMGLPDNHTLVPYKGKPMADGPRYRMCGNSMAVNCMYWIGQRIAIADRIFRWDENPQGNRIR